MSSYQPLGELKARYPSMTLKNAFVPVKTPFDRSYWVTPGKFLVGYYPGDRQKDMMVLKLQGLLDSGIRCVINLMEPDERDHDGLPFLNYVPVLKQLADGGPPIECHRIPIRDLDVPTPAFMIQILDRIDEALKEDCPVYIHCWGGRGRTGTVVGCWLARHGIAEGMDALEMIKVLRRFDSKSHWPSPEMASQIAMVLSWKKGE
jgi:hypothetical protein